MLHNIPSDELGPRGKAMADAVGTCVHCGFCLPACPTYQELESEMDSPRGRILLMKSVLEGNLDASDAQPHVDRCLGCLACVTNCPSGVEYGELVSSYRDHVRTELPEAKPSTLLERFRDLIVSLTLPYPTRFRWALRLGMWTRPLGRLAPGPLRPMLDLLPTVLPPKQRLPSVTPAERKRVGRVALLAGCGQQVLAPDINASAVRVLSQNGIEVVIPENQGCCGALSWHRGEGNAAAKFSEQLISSVPKDVDALVTTAAGCGSAVKEYPLLLAGRETEDAARELAAKSSDISVFLSQIDLKPIPSLHQPMRVAYHDACHLAHAQGVKAEPRKLLQKIPRLEVVEIADSETCCGSAGTYNIEQPEIASRLGVRKAEAIRQTKPSAVVTGNIGCLVQLSKHLETLAPSVPVFHTVQILDRAYRENLS